MATKPMAPPEQVVHPSHYDFGDPAYEPWVVIRKWKLTFALGNAVKYIVRAGRKGDAVVDLRKAIEYINDEIKAYTDDAGRLPLADQIAEGVRYAAEPGVRVQYEEGLPVARPLGPVAVSPKEDAHGHRSAVSAVRAAFRDLHVSVLDDQADTFLRALSDQGWVLIREEDA